MYWCSTWFLVLLRCIKAQLPLLSYLHKKIFNLACPDIYDSNQWLLFVKELLLFSFCRSTPLQVIHILGNFMRIWSVYSLYSYLSNSGDSIVGFIFSCLVPTSVIFLVLQKPWKGRALPNSQVSLYLHFSWDLHPLLDAHFLVFILARIISGCSYSCQWRDPGIILCIMGQRTSCLWSTSVSILFLEHHEFSHGCDMWYGANMDGNTCNV